MKTLILALVMSLVPMAWCQTQQPGEVTVTGVVTSFEVAKSIEINANGTARKFDLNRDDTTYSISPEVATGMTVVATERTGADGKRTLTIVPAPKGAR